MYIYKLVKAHKIVAAWKVMSAKLELYALEMSFVSLLEIPTVHLKRQIWP